MVNSRRVVPWLTVPWPGCRQYSYPAARLLVHVSHLFHCRIGPRLVCITCRLGNLYCTSSLSHPHLITHRGYQDANALQKLQSITYDRVRASHCSPLLSAGGACGCASLSKEDNCGAVRRLLVLWGSVGVRCGHKVLEANLPGIENWPIDTAGAKPSSCAVAWSEQVALESCWTGSPSAVPVRIKAPSLV